MDGPRYTGEQKGESQKRNVKERNKLPKEPYTMIPLLSSWKAGKMKLLYISDKCEEKPKND